MIATFELCFGALVSGFLLFGVDSKFESKKYNWSLFAGHLIIEKLLKTLYIKTNNNYPPLIHNLLRLADKCHIEL